ncbi:salivary glue protein Sgs-3-like [Haliotis asinina]|uniref:salivary glue protein Sgs-3-like n=1 Tax=Haliotis asinina TaxID=109174 RepID=UPI003531C9E7
MDALLTLVVVTLPAVTTELQTCTSGTETSSMQIMLDVSITQIATGGGMCSCRLTVSNTTQVEMFPSTDWTSQCGTYMTIQKWGTSTSCTNGVVQTPSGQTHTVSTGEEVWILMLARKPGANGLSGRLQFKVKPPSVKLNIECFKPNTNSSTTTTPTTTSSTTTTTVPTTVTSMKTTSTRPTSTEKPTTTATDSTPQGQTATASGGTSSRSSAGTTFGSAAASTGSTQAKPTQGVTTDSTKDPFPGGIFAAGVATGIGLVLIAGGLYVVISRRKWWTFHRHKPDDIPLSDAHPTYSGFTPRTEEPMNTYDKIDPKPSKGTDNPYINVS